MVYFFHADEPRRRHGLSMPSPIRTEAVLHSPPPQPSTLPSPSSKRWAPYSSAKDFDTNMATILVVLICATILAFFLHAAVRCLLGRCRHRRQATPADEKGKSGREVAALAEALPSLVYTTGTILAGAEVECAICLADFAEGERVRVLPACNHSFHELLLLRPRDGPRTRAPRTSTPMATILVVLICATILAFFLHAAVRCLLGRYRRVPPQLRASRP